MAHCLLPHLWTADTGSHIEGWKAQNGPLFLGQCSGKPFMALLQLSYLRRVVTVLRKMVDTA